MIYTLTLSPSSDLLIKSDKFELEEVNRYKDFMLLPGGKGINASVILERHGFNNIALSVFDKNTLDSFKEIFEKENVKIQNIDHPEKTRINIKYYGAQNSFELNGPRTVLNSNLKSQISEKLNKLTSQDILLIMGISDEEFLFDILNILNKNKVNFVIDVDSSKFKEFLSFKPFVVKPNIDELQRNLQVQIKSENDLINSMKEIQELGAKNVIVSMDKNGSYLLTDQNEIFKASIIKPINVVSSTGAGDTMISIFSANYLKSNNANESFKLSNSAAMGTVASEWVGDLFKTQKYLENVKVEKLELKK
ncbi:1-phosphofructokinase [Mycoplasmopsis canis PG 14]|uniref:1-phosphofructokinase n=1 Tax=Mycoplasmopsis canis TaxID=29555 RepID=A0A449APX9_9BACT|nr:1-phosphofructokinase family hexose kinase [Mycoplasmopsis canis]AMD81402.1 1-phosphofructokinase [Mycoplasmopsis canis PG 14]EIE40882.1 1-phosphofructokinase [Mycoplasmopsis canis PG 14]VEU68615.1 1-phosphofructokinase [Mycoplasmopsis canis]